jgi:hypothetical protein
MDRPVADMVDQGSKICCIFSAAAGTLTVLAA